MNHKILEILPKKQTPELLYPAYNQAIDEVTEALKKHEACICPSEKELFNLLHNTRVSSQYSNIMIKDFIKKEDAEYLAKAVRKLILEGK